MQIELSEVAQALIDSQMASGGFSSPDEVVEQAIGFFAAHGPGEPVVVDPQTGEALPPEEVMSLIQEGLRDESAGHILPLDVADVKRRGRERMAQEAARP